MKTSTRYNKGLLNGGVRVYSGEIGIGAGRTETIPEKAGGLFFVKNGMSWGGYNMYYVYMNRVILLGSPDGYNPVPSIVIDNGSISITNSASEWRTYKYVLINISSTSDTSDYVGD